MFFNIKIIEFHLYFPNENAASKSIYLAIKNIEDAWVLPIKQWGLILNQYLIIFEHRCRL